MTKAKFISKEQVELYNLLCKKPKKKKDAISGQPVIFRSARLFEEDYNGAFIPAPLPLGNPSYIRRDGGEAVTEVYVERVESSPIDVSSTSTGYREFLPGSVTAYGYVIGQDGIDHILEMFNEGEHIELDLTVNGNLKYINEGYLVSVNIEFSNSIRANFEFRITQTIAT